MKHILVVIVIAPNSHSNTFSGGQKADLQEKAFHPLHFVEDSMVRGQRQGTGIRENHKKIFKEDLIVL